MTQPNPCRNCGSTDLTVQMEDNNRDGSPSQYCQVVCRSCGRKGGPSLTFDDMGDEMTDHEVAVYWWNLENPAPGEESPKWERAEMPNSALAEDGLVARMLGVKVTLEGAPLAVSGAVPMPTQIPVPPELHAELLEIGHRLRTQDNRCTESPIFQVRGKRRIYGMDPDYGDDQFEWISLVDDFMVVEAPEDEDNPPEDVEKLYYILVEDILATAFTEEGCKEHLKRNRHNYKNYDEVFIYADSIWRCPEMLAIRKFLMSLPESPRALEQAGEGQA